MFVKRYDEILAMLQDGTMCLVFLFKNQTNKQTKNSMIQ